MVHAYINPLPNHWRDHLHREHNLGRVMEASRQVRWTIQSKRKSDPDEWWAWSTTDETYAGWFYSDGEDSATEALLRDWEEAKQRLDFLHLRLVKDVRSYNVSAPYRGPVGVIESTCDDDADQ